MPIGGASGIGHDESAPPDSQSAGLGDDHMRSIRTSFRQALDSEHNYPSGGGDAVGYHRFGSARPYFGTQSQVSSSGSDSRIMVTSDTSRLFGVGSTGTVMLGAGPGSLSIGSGLVVPQRHHWVDEFGLGTTDSNGSVLITIPNSGYSGVPFVLLTRRTASTSSTAWDLYHTPVDGATFVVSSLNPNSSVFMPSQEFTWLSRGSRAL